MSNAFKQMKDIVKKGKEIEKENKKPKVYGYCRISRKQQNIDRQIRNIKEIYPTSIIIEEKWTGTSLDRPNWNKLVSQLKKGDTVVFDSVSRMSRSAEDGFTAYKDFYNKGINLIFLKEPHINTQVYKSKLESINIPDIGVETLKPLMKGLEQTLILLAEEQFKLAFDQAEKEVMDLRRRTKEGIETARLNGKQIGRAEDTKVTTKKSIKAKADIKKYSKDFDGVLKDVEVMKIVGVSRNSYYKYKRELLEEV